MINRTSSLTGSRYPWWFLLINNSKIIASDHKDLDGEENMSQTREAWNALKNKIRTLMYEQNDSYMNMSYEQALPYINAEMESWTFYQLETYVRENF